MSDKPKPASSNGQPSRGKMEKALKWVGSITAVLSLIFALIKALEMVSDVRDRQRQINELYEVAKLQQANFDYNAAWASFEQAMAAAEPGGQLAKLTGQLGDERTKLRAAQEDLAMDWLRNIRITQDQTFSDIVKQLVPVLERGAVSASGSRKADLLAHVGWANFLRWRAGQRDLNPEPIYQQALAIDSTNSYAHANLGHWQFWQRENLAEASRHFSAAIAAGREREYVRKMQLAAAKNLGSEGDALYLAAINDMQKNSEPIDESTRNDLFSIYHFTCASRYDSVRFTALLSSVPASEQVATYRALFYGEHDGDFDQWKGPGRDAGLACLLEAAQQPGEALQIWQQLQQNLPTNYGGNLKERAREAVKRLTSR